MQNGSTRVERKNGMRIEETGGGIDDSDVTYEMHLDHGNFLAWAKVGGRRVGDLATVNQGSRVMLLGFVEAYDAVSVSDSVIARLIRKVRPDFKIESFRKRGIGTQLLLMLLAHCRENDIAEIYGSVVQSNLDENPGLLGWYQKHGFEVRSPDSRCLRGAVSMVVWKAMGSFTC